MRPAWPLFYLPEIFPTNDVHMATSSIEVQIKEESPVSKLVEVTVPAAQLSSDVDSRLKRVAKTARIKGFRPGKAPMKLIRQRYGAGARADALDAIVRKSLMEALKREDLKETVHVTQPEVEKGLVDGEDIAFKFTAETLPKIEPKGYLGIAVEKLKIAVEDGDVDHQIEHLQENHIEVVPVEDRDVVEAGDVVVVSYQAVGEGEVEQIFANDQQVDLGAGGLLDGLAEGIVGSKVDEQTTIDVTLPEQFALESVAGQTIQIELTVSEIKTKEVPAVDDDFAKLTGLADDVAGLKAKVREQIEEEWTSGAENNAKTRLMDAIVEANEFELPEHYVNSRAEGEARGRLSRMGINPDEVPQLIPGFAADIKDQVERGIREAIILRAVAAEEKLKVTDKEIDERITKLAEENNQPVARVKAQFARGDAREQLRTSVLFDKVVEKLWTSAKVEEVDHIEGEDPRHKHHMEHHAHEDAGDDAADESGDAEESDE